MSEDQWEDVQGGQLVKWSEAKTIEGLYQGFVTVQGQYGEQKRYSLLEGNTLLDFYGPAILQRQLADPRIVQGTRIQIEYTGNLVQTKSGRSAKEFIIRVAK